MRAGLPLPLPLTRPLPCPFVEMPSIQGASARLPRLDAWLDLARIEALRSTLAHRRSAWRTDRPEGQPALVEMDPIHPPNTTTAVLMLDSGDAGAQLAAALAVDWARHEGRTLLVDADLAHPSLHRLFGLGIGPGLGELLDEDTRADRVGGTHPGAAVTSSSRTAIGPCLHGVEGAPDLLLLTAGRLRRRGAQAVADAMAGPALAEHLAGWRRHHAQVVISCSGAARGTPALAVAHAAGQVLLLARSQHTPVRAMHRLLTRLALLRVAVLGAVVVHD